MLRDDWPEEPLRIRRAQQVHDAAGIRWGVAELDELWPLHADDLVLIGARGPRGSREPATTALALRLAFQLARSGEVAMFTPTAAAEVAIDAVAAASGVAAHRLRAGFCADDEVPRIAAAVDELRGCGVLVDDRPGLTWAEFEDTARCFAEKRGAVAVVVDRPELLVEDNFADLSASLKRLARTCNVPMVAIARAAAVTTSTSSLDISDLPGRGGIARAADLVATVDRPSDTAPAEFTVIRSLRANPSATVVLTELIDSFFGRLEPTASARRD